MVLSIIGFSRTGVQSEIDRFLFKLSPEPNSIHSLSKSAFTQARSKLKPAAFVQIRNIQTQFFENFYPSKSLWKDKRVVAIDGSHLILPKENALGKHFGTFSNQSGTSTPGARTSIAYDVLNGLILDAKIDKLESCEKELASSHLNMLDPSNDILLFDRGYPSFWLVGLLQMKGYSFCFRLSSAWKEAFRATKLNNDQNWVLIKNDKTKGIDKIVEFGLPDKINGLRLVSFELKNGEKEMLLTNLTDDIKYTKDVMKELYNLRWGIEGCYKRLKQVVHIEYFSGRTVHAIEQDFHARTIMLNMASMIEPHVNKINIKPELQKNRYDKKATYCQIVMKLKDFWVGLFYQNNFHGLFNKMLGFLKSSFDIERKGRSFIRNKSFKNKRKPLNYKST